MQTLQELGLAAAQRRRALGLRQQVVAAQAGITPESLSRFERGRLAELGIRKLLAVLAILGLELELVTFKQSGLLDELRLERSGVPAGHLQASCEAAEGHRLLIRDVLGGLEDVSAKRTGDADAAIANLQLARESKSR